MPVVSGVGEAERSQHLHYYNCTTPNIIPACRRQTSKHLVRIPNPIGTSKSKWGREPVLHISNWMVDQGNKICMYVLGSKWGYLGFSVSKERLFWRVQCKSVFPCKFSILLNHIRAKNIGRLTLLITAAKNIRRIFSWTYPARAVHALCPVGLLANGCGARAALSIECLPTS